MDGAMFMGSEPAVISRGFRSQEREECDIYNQFFKTSWTNDSLPPTTAVRHLDHICFPQKSESPMDYE